MEQQKTGQLHKEALNCLEHMLINDEIDAYTYQCLREVIKLFGENNKYHLGDGLFLCLKNAE